MNCKNCKHLFTDSSVGHAECTMTELMTDKEYQEYLDTDTVTDCPFYEPIPPEPEILIVPAPPFSDVLRRIRKEKHFTQERAYKLLQVPRRTYEDWERGIASPPEYVQRFVIKLLQQEETHMENTKQYTGYRHYIMVNKLKDSPETYEHYLRETNSGSTPEWLIKETAKRTYNYRFITNPDAMV